MACICVQPKAAELLLGPVHAPFSLTWQNMYNIMAEGNKYHTETEINMKICPNCGAQLDDSNTFCTSCGTPLATDVVSDPRPVEPSEDPAEDDIAKNKLFGIIVYAGSILGIIVALLGAPDSPFVRFHVRQALKLTICEAIIAMASLLLAWTVIVPIAGAIAGIILLVVTIICFINACKGCMEEPPIVKNIAFLK